MRTIDQRRVDSQMEPQTSKRTRERESYWMKPDGITKPWRIREWTSLAVMLLACSIHSPAQQLSASSLPDEPSPQNQAQAAIPSQTPLLSGSISGVVIDETGAAITTATVRLTFREPAQSADTKTDGDGEFTFPTKGSGAFMVSVTAPGFAGTSIPGVVSAGQIYTLPPVTLVAGSSSEVQVNVTREEMAQEQLNDETKQRFLGAIPNYYMSYDPHPLPLTTKQKFTLAGRFMLDPVSFGLTGLTAGLQQANNDYSGFGQGASGYGKRYAADTGAYFNSILLGGAILPSILRQDPRYFYKGTGSIKERALYAIANTVICKGDNGRWQPNYSSVGGGLAASAISNYYYPAKDRDGAETIFINAGIGLAEEAVENLAQEFLFRKLTSHTQKAKTTPQP